MKVLIVTGGRDYRDRDRVWIARLREYQEAHTVLGEALLMVNDEPRAAEIRESVPATQVGLL
jgi:hypothetical protein